MRVQYFRIISATTRFPRNQLVYMQIFEKGFSQSANPERPWVRGWGFFIHSQQDLKCL